MKKVLIGTSGWSYSWNPDGFDWYLQNSNLNAVELNMSFYRFPFPNMVKSWARKTPENFFWSIKVNKWITHNTKFSEKSYSLWKKFHRIFEPLEDKINFYLFQLPAKIQPTEKFLSRVVRFLEETNIVDKFVLEGRTIEWFSEETLNWARENKVTLCSVDAPFLINGIVKTTDIVYLRFHGREFWYSYNYSVEELAEIAEQIIKKNPDTTAVFFNNNHDMLHNANEFKQIIAKLIH